MVEIGKDEAPSLSASSPPYRHVCIGHRVTGETQSSIGPTTELHKLAKNSTAVLVTRQRQYLTRGAYWISAQSPGRAFVLVLLVVLMKF